MKRRADTICWTCRRATDSSCAWVRSFRPVKGWTAEKTMIRQQGDRFPSTPSWRIEACPLYVKDAQTGERLTMKRLGACAGLTAMRLRGMTDKQLIETAKRAGFDVSVERTEKGRRVLMLNK